MNIIQLLQSRARNQDSGVAGNPKPVEISRKESLMNHCLLRGLWVVISRAISRITIVIRGLITHL